MLVVSVRGSSRSQAVRDSKAVVDAYLETRTAWLVKRRTRLTTGLEDQMNQLRTNVLPGQPTRSSLNAVMVRLTSADTSAGRIVRASGVGSPPSRTPEAVTSGIALGLLVGCMRLKNARRRR